MERQNPMRYSYVYICCMPRLTLKPSRLATSRTMPQRRNRQTYPRIDTHETIVAERCATLHIGNASLDIYPGCDAEQLKMLVELLRLC